MTQGKYRERRFGGKLFGIAGGVIVPLSRVFSKKKRADRVAREYRSRGYRVRIIKVKGGYSLFVKRDRKTRKAVR